MDANDEYEDPYFKLKKFCQNVKIDRKKILIFLDIFYPAQKYTKPAIVYYYLPNQIFRPCAIPVKLF